MTSSPTNEERRAQREQWHAKARLTAPTTVSHAAMVKANDVVTKALRDRVLRPWPVCANPECNQRHVMAHHVSYDPLFWLQVVWLCRRCHTRLHAEHRARELRCIREGRISGPSVNSTDTREDSP